MHYKLNWEVLDFKLESKVDCFKSGIHAFLLLTHKP